MLFRTGLKFVRNAAKAQGVVIDRYKPHQDKFKVLSRLCTDHKCDIILDVGANDGGFARDMFEASFHGTILSVEPMEEPWKAIISDSQFNDRWKIADRMCLGAEDGYVTFNVSANSTSSSILDVLPKSVEAHSGTRYIDRIKVPVRRLDTLVATNVDLADQERFALKLDVQGYESAVLDGAGKCISDIPVVMAEMSLSPLYAGAPSFEELFSRLTRLGYACAGIFQGFTNTSSMRTLQVDGIFERVGT